MTATQDEPGADPTHMIAALQRRLDAAHAERDAALAQKAALAEILEVINRSPADPQPVFDAILTKAHALCGAAMGGMKIFDGALFRSVATHFYPPDLDAFVRRPHPPNKFDQPLIDGARMVQVDDMKSLEDAGGSPRSGRRSGISIPLRKDGDFLGLISAFRTTMEPFSDTEIALLESFAAQAMIAMENARLLGELQARTAELAARNNAFAEQIEHQSATIDVLKAMSASQGDAQPVFDLVAKRAREICNGEAAALLEFDGTLVHCRSTDVDEQTVAPGVTDAYRALFPQRPSRASIASRAILYGEVIHIANPADDPELSQASRVIFRELEARTAALAERNSAFAEQVEHQAATIDVLKVMSSSGNDTQPVFDIILRRAMDLCGGVMGGIWEYDGAIIQCRALGGFSPEVQEKYLALFPMPPTSKFGAGRAILSRKMSYISDVEADPDYDGAAAILGHRSTVFVPLLRDGTPVGALGVGSPNVDGFTEAHRDLLQTFAEQAAIAMGSVATFRELQERTAALSRSVAELQALEEVLLAVNSSLDLETVLATIIDRAVPLAQADEGMIYEFDAAEQVFVPKAAYGMTDDRVAALRERRIRLGETYLGRSAVDRIPIAVDDVQQDASTPEARSLLQGIHAVLAVPLLREQKVVGGLVIRRRTEGAFAPATVALMQTFAAQSVLAIANARVFDEIQARSADLAEALEMQSATADVLKAISRTAYDLDTVLRTLVTTAVRITDAGGGGQIFRRDGEVYRYAASQMNVDPAYLEHEKRAEIVAGRGTLIGRVALEKRTVQIVDAWNDPEYTDKEAARVAPVRAMLGVPLLRDGEPIGTFTVARPNAIPFTERQVELVTTFADQAVIAIENVRLFNEVQARTEELAKSLDNLRRAQDRLVQTEKMASLGQLTAGIAHEIKNPLNFVNNFSELSTELIEELREALGPAPIDKKLRTEIDDLTGLLRSNLEKVVQHGKRADGIVKNMLLHSRESGGEMRSVDVNATVEEALNLAYHGARAEKPGFNISLVRNFDPNVGALELYPQEFTRVLLNLFSNGFYAAVRKQTDTADPAFEPTLTVTTELHPAEIAIRIRDNGIGIPDAVRAKMFEPFFTTKPAGEGTGLGLSLSHDIVVKQHGGNISVDSTVGKFTEFTVTLPRANNPGTTS